MMPMQQSLLQPWSPASFNFSVPPPPLYYSGMPPLSMAVPPPPMPMPMQSSSMFPMASPQLPQLPQQQMQQPSPAHQRRPDPGYESEEKESDANSTAPTEMLSRPASACDSARVDSEDETDTSQLKADLAGFRGSGPRPVDMALSQQMEIVWHERFEQLFGSFPHGSWHLLPVFDPPDLHNTGIPRNQWRYFVDQAKVRFICMKCQKAWTSMGGQVVFWVYKNDATNEGYVHFKLYGQKCNECNSKYYEHAIWYQEEVEKVMENLFKAIGHLYYGEPSKRKRVDRRIGHPRTEHNSATCQACSDKVCRSGKLQKHKHYQQKQQQNQHQHHTADSGGKSEVACA